MKPRTSTDAGFTLAELLVAMGLALCLVVAVFALMNPQAVTAQAQPEAADMQQRMRVAADALFNDLVEAGAGLDAGVAAGPLVSVFAPVVPRRLGRTAADPYNAARSDAITVTYVPATAAQATIASALPAAGGDVTLDGRPGCPIAPSVCGFAADSDAVVFDEAGHADVFRVTAVGGGLLHLEPRDAGADFTFAAGARIAHVVTHTYYLDVPARQLRRYDGYLSDTPLVDHVVGLAFAYFGDPDPPFTPVPSEGTENCLYDLAGQRRTATLTPAGGSLAPLPLSILDDGPWCGSGSARFDADLLRVRRVRVALRVEAADPAFRALGPAFAAPGSARNALQALPDSLLTFDVAPRNMSLEP
jgi:hypothetical protein